MKSLAPAVAVTAMLLALPAQAQRSVVLQARTAGELAELCAANPKDPQGDAKINFCHGFAQGAITGRAAPYRGQEAVLFPQPGADPHRHHGRVRHLGSRLAGAQDATGDRGAVPVPGRTLSVQINVRRPA